MMGAGKLTSALFRIPDCRATANDVGQRYKFNLYRVSPSTGRTSHFLTPDDLSDLVKLTQVLCAEIAHDGWLSEKARAELWYLEKALEAINCYTHECKNRD